MKNPESYRFGPFVLDSRRRTLSRADSAIALTPKAFDVLHFLVQHPNRLVTKEELLHAVWGDTFVEEGNLAQYISHLRKALGDNLEDTRLIVTIARKGYQFTATVTVDGVTETPAAEPPEAAAPSRVRSFRWKASLALAASFILAGTGFFSWEHFQAAGTPKSQQRVMLAVLPFKNLTGDPGKEYLADGLTEEMISQLSRLAPDQVGVIARTSVMGYKHKDDRLDQVGRDLSVQYILESSLRESGNHLRLTAQLIHVKDQMHLWSKDYDYLATDILKVEDDVAAAVAQEVRVRLTSNKPASKQPRTVNPEAFDAYLKGFYFFQRNTNSDTEMSAKYYERATQLDPSYALAWAGLARVRHWQGTIGLLPRQEGARHAREAVERALALEPNLAAAHIEMARIHNLDDLDWIASNASMQRAMSSEPWNPDAVRGAAMSAGNLARFDQALQLSRQAIALDPLSPENWSALAEIEFNAGQLEQASLDNSKALELSPDVWPGHILSSKISLMRGRPEQTLREVQLVRYESFRRHLEAMAYYALARSQESDAALNDCMSKFSHGAYLIAQVYAFRRQSNEAFQWLDRAYAQREDSLYATKIDPFLKLLNNDPRYAAFLKKLNFPN